MALTRKKPKHAQRPSRRGEPKQPRAAPNAREIVARIDEMMRELEGLRRQLQNTKPAPSRSLTEELFGAAGHGTREEYDPLLDYERFSEWQFR